MASLACAVRHISPHVVVYKLWWVFLIYFILFFYLPLALPLACFCSGGDAILYIDISSD